VVPLEPEFVVPQDGALPRQNCSRNIDHCGI
jgi:hypothetical protein